MSDTNEPIMTIFQRFGGQTVAWITLSLGIALPIPAASDADLSPAHDSIAKRIEMQAFPAYFPNAWNGFVDPGLAPAETVGETQSDDLGWDVKIADQNQDLIGDLLVGTRRDDDPMAGGAGSVNVFTE